MCDMCIDTNKSRIMHTFEYVAIAYSYYRYSTSIGTMYIRVRNQ